MISAFLNAQFFVSQRELIAFLIIPLFALAESADSVISSKIHLLPVAFASGLYPLFEYLRGMLSGDLAGRVYGQK